MSVDDALGGEYFFERAVVDGATHPVRFGNVSVRIDGGGRSTGGGSRGRISKMLSVPSNQPRPAPGAKDIGARSPLALLCLAASCTKIRVFQRNQSNSINRSEPAANRKGWGAHAPPAL